MKNEYKYFAFISYNSADDKWAKWLQRQLENYNLPTIIKNEKGEVIKSYDKKPKKFKVFRYVSDLNAKTLNEGLSGELDNSQNLIVICSPRSAKSEWVGKEIQHFIDTDRKRKIVPFIVDGTSYSNDENECLNKVLKDNFEEGDILGVNINESGDTSKLFSKRKAVAKTVALLLETPDAYSFLWNRYRHRLYRNLVLWAIGVLLVLAALFYVWRVNQPIDVEMRLNEASAHNAQLPPLKDAVVIMTLDNETKTDTIHAMDEAVLFTNIPHRFLNKEVRVLVECQDFLPVDTTIALAKESVVDIRRNPAVYGEIHFRLWNPNTEQAISNSKLEIEGHEILPDKDGLVQLTLPLGQQRPAYKVVSSVPLETDSIYMPCGEDDVLLAK
ncbi:MAG: toll/interleukin-1 receptor domain-containing protein [Prevotella sp.]|nr:toll/interleukin-1 receptor domain-containing protein [Prevotella sp.]